MAWLQIESQFEPMLRALGLSSFETITKHFTHGSMTRGEVFVTPARLNANATSMDVFFKLYRHERPSWRFWKRDSKARREFQNYRQLETLGVPVAQRVAVGEQRDVIGRLKSAFIITVAVPGARTLIEFAQDQPMRAGRLRIYAELSRAVRVMHEANFFHHDLVWRNVLVNERGEIVLIDCPRGGVSHFGKERRRLRDLASLDKSAWKFCRRTERLRFLLAYLGKTRVDDEARTLIHTCLSYRRTRWPEDWSGK
ncbi:MAG TPA: lipopolysaccharide kinase InaA family protein [Candidatus Acidoferrum sp.]|nr:lipopolysaccharide kinase InaA family protein [Candidatus Acidoferrum sp.]